MPVPTPVGAKASMSWGSMNLIYSGRTPKPGSGGPAAMSRVPSTNVSEEHGLEKSQDESLGTKETMAYGDNPLFGGKQPERRGIQDLAAAAAAHGTSTDGMSASVAKKGLLWRKEEGKKKAKWHLHWFELRDSTLRCFASVPDSSDGKEPAPTMIVSLDNTSVRKIEADEIGRDWCFELTDFEGEGAGSEPTVVLAATTVRDQQQWLAALRTVCAMADQETEDIYPGGGDSNASAETKRMTDMMRGRVSRVSATESKRVTGAFEWVINNPMPVTTSSKDVFRPAVLAEAARRIEADGLKRCMTVPDKELRRSKHAFSSPVVRGGGGAGGGGLFGLAKGKVNGLGNDTSIFVRAVKRANMWHRDGMLQDEDFATVLAELNLRNRTLADQVTRGQLEMVRHSARLIYEEDSFRAKLVGEKKKTGGLSGPVRRAGKGSQMRRNNTAFMNSFRDNRRTKGAVSVGGKAGARNNRGVSIDDVSKLGQAELDILRDSERGSSESSRRSGHRGSLPVVLDDDGVRTVDLETLRDSLKGLTIPGDLDADTPKRVPSGDTPTPTGRRAFDEMSPPPPVPPVPPAPQPGADAAEDALAGVHSLGSTANVLEGPRSILAKNLAGDRPRPRSLTASSADSSYSLSEKVRAAAAESVTKQRDSAKGVTFGDARIRFYDYTIGLSCPGSGGPPVGLDWEWEKHGEVTWPVEELEEFRGGNPPEMEDSDEEEEWNDNWRLPREYFQDEGSLPKERRIDILRTSGHRRASIDLSTHQAMFLLASRRKHSRSKVSKFIVEGFDAEEIFQLDREVDAAEIISTWASRWLREAQQAERQKNSSVINAVALTAAIRGGGAIRKAPE